MKKLLYLIPVCLMLLCACQKTDYFAWDGPDALHFDDSVSVFYSFVNTMKSGEDTVWITVNLMGDKTPYDRVFHLTTIAKRSTADVGLHYSPLKEEYMMEAGTVKVKIPVVVFDKDTLLKKEPVALVLQLEPGRGLTNGYAARLEKTIYISNRYEKPVIWTDDELGYFFGAYSRTKHEICVRQIKRQFPQTQEEYNEEFAFWKAWGKKMADYFEDNVVYDENGQKIATWSVGY